ncbi:MAG: hypothetical protein QOH06_4330 [Acidobacteriota bacterium]|jgi:hypothetical protein|nr:hypothetical protein [Acidobacteriota bacterium]
MGERLSEAISEETPHGASLQWQGPDRIFPQCRDAPWGVSVLYRRAIAPLAETFSIAVLRLSPRISW